MIEYTDGREEPLSSFMNNKTKNIRKKTLELVYRAKAPHIGSALSCVEIIAALYETSDKYKIKNNADDRDRIILSKGHAIAAQLATLCEYGLLNWTEVKNSFCANGSVFFENTSPYTPFIEAATGSLGQGVSYAVGTALGMKMKGFDTSKSYAIVGDGELNEGQCWEGIQQAGIMGLSNFVLIIDNNRLAGIGEVCAPSKWDQIFEGFGYRTYNIDGNNYEKVYSLITSIKSMCYAPTAIICNTIKGKGVSFMENNNDWHYRPISDDDYMCANKELI